MFIIAQKSKNEFAEEKERREKAQRKFYVTKREKLVKRRLGLSRTNQQICIQGMAMGFVETPHIVRERWFHCRYGRTYHFAVLCYRLRSEDGRQWTALQAQAHDADHGFMLSVTGFWNLKPA